MPDLYSQVFTAPTRASVGGNSHAASINDFNQRIRQAPWYQQWFKSQGLDPNRVQLSKDQRKQLEGVLRAHGIPLTDKMNIDPAGNLNTPHGFASQPGWLKAVEIAAPIAATAFFTGGGSLTSLPGFLGGGSSTVGGASLGATTAASGTVAAAAPTILTAAGPMAASSLPAITGPAAGATIAAAAPHVARAGMSIGGILEHAAPDLVKAGTGLYAAHQANSANDRAAQLTAQSNRDVLEYTKLKDEQERQDFLNTQQRNYELYKEAQARLDPYRQFGQRSLAQLASPIPGVGSIGARMGA